MTEQNSGICK